MNKKLTIIDFFCGAGGFSEGFRQNGFKVIAGIDYWKPAIETFNFNFDLNNQAQDIQSLQNIEKINELPNTDIIIGSPPCVDFSSSNKCGNADKTKGINLIEVFLKIIAVKKHKKNSQLKAWFMENVVNSSKYTKEKYTFKDLDLVEWAKNNQINPNQIAINVKDNTQVLNSSNFGVAQSRKRLFVGELISTGKFPKLKEPYLQQGLSVKEIFKEFPSPFNKTQKEIIDPNYAHVKLNNKQLTDYAYDTGIYKSHWEYSQWCKENHPYMGKMSFPENKDKPSRTITATKLDNSREAIIYESERKRKDNGQYRTPTIREIAVLMSFPISYQFLGSENTKWRLVGNAVCPLTSSAIAKAVLKILNKKTPKAPIINTKIKIDKVNNLGACTF